MLEKKKETRGRKPIAGVKMTPAQIAARAKQKLLEEGGICIGNTAIRDPELAKRIVDRAERLGVTRNDVAREALEFFFAHDLEDSE